MVRQNIKEKAWEISKAIIFLSIFGIACYYIGLNTQSDLPASQYGAWLEKLPKDGPQLPVRISMENTMETNESLTLYGDYTIVQYADSNSMLPILDQGTKGIVMPINKNTELQVGDIISFVPRNQPHTTIPHRIISIESDIYGEYFITKGDSLKIHDNQKVRREQIKHVLVGVLW